MSRFIDGDTRPNRNKQSKYVTHSSILGITQFNHEF